MQDQSTPLHGVTILQVLPALGTGGVERGTLEITEAITRAGGRAIVASSGGPLSAQIRRAGATMVTLPLNTKNPFKIRRNAARLADLILSERVSIIHARSRAPAWSAWWAAQRTHTPFLTTYHGVYSENFPLKRAYNAVMTKGKLVIAVSHHVARTILTREPSASAKIRVIHRGADLALFNPANVNGERLARLAERWRLPPEQRPIILLPGRLTRWKGAEVTIQALARLENRKAFLILAGPEQGTGQFSRELIELAQKLGVADRLRLTGNCDDMQAAYQIADAVVTPSLKPEPFGRTNVEAQAMARVVISSNHGGASETIAHGTTGFLVPPNDPAHLAAAIDYVLKMLPLERAAFGAQARAAVAKHFSKESMQAATIEVYRELLT
jgi:glycosyltransferase involved in cell wall biosynthesis